MRQSDLLASTTATYYSKKDPIGVLKVVLWCGPEGNRTPDLFHAKNEIGGSPFSTESAACSFGCYRKQLGGFLVA